MPRLTVSGLGTQISSSLQYNLRLPLSLPSLMLQTKTFPLKLYGLIVTAAILVAVYISLVMLLTKILTTTIVAWGLICKFLVLREPEKT